MRNGVKTALVGGVFTAMVGVAGYGAFNLYNGVTGGSSASADSGPTTGPPTGAEVEKAAASFFKRWENGDADAAADFTNDPVAAGRVLHSFTGADITKVKIEQGEASGANVPFTVSATVAYGGKSEPLSYKSQLKVVRGESTGRALVDWQPTVIHPELKRDDTLEVGEADNPQIEAVDRDGKVLSREKYPSLGPVLDQLRERFEDKAGGKPGIELWIERADQTAYNTTLVTLQKGEPGKIKTTLSARVQAAAEKAVRSKAKSSVVAIQPSTGQVLAVANQEPGNNVAFLGRLAPGSTMKIVTAATFIDNGVAVPSTRIPCEHDIVYRSQTFHNLPGLQANLNATLADNFARSCNTGFIKGIAHDNLKDDSLTREAAKFGIGANWQTGISSYDGSVPAAANSDRGANAIGQGVVQMSPLNMASIVATVQGGGTFRQPVIVDSSYGLDRATANGISTTTASQLAQMMRTTAHSGSAADAMRGLGAGVGAKTGSAEVAGQEKPNSWFAGFRGDIAVAAVVIEGGRGGEAAGPIVAQVLAAN
ncbi:penicillin-binding transpeptidase domain-containing protein [Streptomyces indicus]|uniref:NTF2-like N-terminal transpeptidase domain-containing protein n=1 Tax=Streptomyces indicus TaxID=417292 RepID=A0A1G9GY09_9ACTN|nr:penicillin-binding transpeptidase domain-containing protein [Streptomyces indicus]SDL05578.1 NTF2-like N-terminal transpeptidase domain-containing protein [Streptomyces indicus]